MPSPERGLITALVGAEDLDKVLPYIKKRWFFDQEARRAFDIIHNHFEEYREPISKRLLLEELPSFPFEHYGDAPLALAKRVEDKWLRNRLVQIGDMAAAESAADVREALSNALVNLSDLKGSVGGASREDADVAATMGEAWDRYIHRRDNKGRMGIPFMWEPMQRSTLGAQNGGYYLLYARPKNMKTFVMLAQLNHWYYHFRRRVVVFTRELSIQQMQDRILCMFAGVDYLRFRGGELTDVEEALLEDASEAITEIGGYHVATVDGYGAAAAAQIETLADQYEIGEGDVIAVDGLYFYAENSEWSSFGAFSRGLKQIFLKRGCVGLCTSQGNRTSAKARGINADAGMEMQMGDQPIQDCDAAVKLRLDQQEQHIHCVMSTLREGRPAEWTINAKPCYDFGVKFSDNPVEDEAVDVTPRIRVRDGKVTRGHEDDPDD